MSRPMNMLMALCAALLAWPTLASAEEARANPTLELVFEETVTLGEFVDVGTTALGGRTIIPITGGTFSGPNMRGEIMPGGWDYQLLRADGCRSLSADYFLRTDDGVVIHVLNQGVDCPNAPAAGIPGIRTAAVFEAPLGKYEWLGHTPLVGIVEPFMTDTGLRVFIRFYRVR